jgi:hypothetical protein
MGSQRVVAVADRMTYAARRDTGPDAFVELRAAFVNAARQDLGVT